MAQEHEQWSDFPQWVIKHTKPGAGDYLPPNFPYIIDDAQGEICQVALLYMTDKHLTRNLTYNAPSQAGRDASLREASLQGTFSYGKPLEAPTPMN